ncbi:MAG: hypothetical protein K2N24_08705, partial [Lachnospiraceae bacterium]|nr:hypothetical protein [Lachnospiraceae bacterium]
LSMMKVAIEERGEQKLPITVVTKGETQEGYAVVSAAATPNMVTVTGAASKVKDIKTVRVEVDVEGLNTSISTRGELILLDADGDPIESDKITRNLSTVSVKVVIQKTKEVPIQIVPSGEVAEGFGIAGPIEYQPTTVLIAGEEEVLRSIREISIEDIDITGLNSDYETTLDINNYLPDGVVIADSTQNIAVKINIEKLVERTLSIKLEDIDFTGADDRFQYEVVSEEKQFELTVTGLKRDLDALTVQDLQPSIDVSDYTGEGTYNARVDLQDLEHIQYDSTISTRVTVTRAASATEEETEDTGTDSGTTEAGTNH